LRAIVRSAVAGGLVALAAAIAVVLPSLLVGPGGGLTDAPVAVAVPPEVGRTVVRARERRAEPARPAATPAAPARQRPAPSASPSPAARRPAVAKPAPRPAPAAARPAPAPAPEPAPEREVLVTAPEAATPPRGKPVEGNWPRGDGLAEPQWERGAKPAKPERPEGAGERAGRPPDRRPQGGSVRD
jgi:hypothetical protein